MAREKTPAAVRPDIPETVHAPEVDHEARRRARRRLARVVKREATVEAAEPFTRPRVGAALWLGLLGPPMLLLLHQQLNYMLVPWACRHESPWVLHLVSLALIAATLLVGLMAFRLWQHAGGEWESQGEGPLPRSRFLGMIGVASSVLSTLIIFSQWLPILYITPCRGG